MGGVGTVTLATRTVQFGARIIIRLIFLLKSYAASRQLNRFPTRRGLVTLRVYSGKYQFRIAAFTTAEAASPRPFGSQIEAMQPDIEYRFPSTAPPEHSEAHPVQRRSTAARCRRAAPENSLGTMQGATRVDFVRLIGSLVRSDDPSGDLPRTLHRACGSQATVWVGIWGLTAAQGGNEITKRMRFTPRRLNRAANPRTPIVTVEHEAILTKCE